MIHTYIVHTYIHTKHLINAAPNEDISPDDHFNNTYIQLLVNS